MIDLHVFKNKRVMFYASLSRPLLWYLHYYRRCLEHYHCHLTASTVRIPTSASFTKYLALPYQEAPSQININYTKI